MALVATAAALVGLSLAAPRVEAHGDGTETPVLVIHGLDAFGSSGIDCSATFNSMMSTLDDYGWSFRTIGYYDGDTNCGWDMNHHGSHSKHHSTSDGHSSGGHTNDARIEHLGYHFAWQVYDHWSKNGVEVDVIAHSMGGLITRYALAQVERDHPDFPPYLYVEDVETMGTPHGGTDWAKGCYWSTQCDQMVVGSPFMNWLKNYAWHPDGTGSWPTRWTNMGSVDDEVVHQNSSIEMGAENDVIYLEGSDVMHSDYYKDTSWNLTADLQYRRDCCNGWKTSYDSRWPVRWTHMALYYDYEW